jgi:hypothetical protein
MPQAPKLRSYLIVLFVATPWPRGQSFVKAHSRLSRADWAFPREGNWVDLDPAAPRFLKNRPSRTSASPADELQRPVPHRQVSH